MEYDGPFVPVRKACPFSYILASGTPPNRACAGALRRAHSAARVRVFDFGVHSPVLLESHANCACRNGPRENSAAVAKLFWSRSMPPLAAVRPGATTVA